MVLEVNDPADTQTAQILLLIGETCLGDTINGKPPRIPGAPAQATTVVITTKDYREFLAR